MVLYKLEFDFSCLLKSLLPIILISVGFFYFGIKQWRTRTVGLKILSILFFTISIGCFFVFIFNLSGDIVTYKEYSTILNDETFDSVSGNVSNFKSADSHGKGEESFSVDGVEFSYAQYEDFIGYHTVSTKGGIIVKNGQLLTIDYIYDEHLEKNIILQIKKCDG